MVAKYFKYKNILSSCFNINVGVPMHKDGRRELKCIGVLLGDDWMQRMKKWVMFSLEQKHLVPVLEMSTTGSYFYSKHWAALEPQRMSMPVSWNVDGTWWSSHFFNSTAINFHYIHSQSKWMSEWERPSLITRLTKAHALVQRLLDHF